MLVTNHATRRRLTREAMRRGATVLPYSPHVIYVDPSNVCDLRCTFCPQSRWGQRKRGLMSYELFQRILDEVVELKPHRLYLFCYGEALLHKRIFDMIRNATDRGLWVRIHTNAKSLDETKAKQLLESGLTELRFSFDTADRELYNRLRVRSDFDLVVGNIRRFLRLKQEEGREFPAVHVQEIVPFVPHKLPQNTDAYRELFKGHAVTFDARYMHNFAGGSSESDFEVVESEGQSQCQQIYTRIVVTFDGKMHACCLDAEGHNIIGDLMAEDTIASAWNGPAMQHLRQLTNERQLAGLKPCENCDILRADQTRSSFAKTLIGRLYWRIHGHNHQPRPPHVLKPVVSDSLPQLPVLSASSQD